MQGADLIKSHNPFKKEYPLEYEIINLAVEKEFRVCPSCGLSSVPVLTAGRLNFPPCPKLSASTRKKAEVQMSRPRIIPFDEYLMELDSLELIKHPPVLTPVVPHEGRDLCGQPRRSGSGPTRF